MLKKIICFVVLVGVVQCILSNPGDTKISSKTTESTKKSDQLDSQAQASHGHSLYGGFGDNSLGTGFGGTGLGSFGDQTGSDLGYGGYHNYGGHDHHHHDHHHKHHDDGGYHKALAIKGLLIPLAGVALLGAAAAFVSNPILLQLGVISGTYAGKRRRREADHGLDLDESAARLEAQARLSQIQTLERFMAQIPKEEMFTQEKKLMANYLTCSGMGEQNSCLERLACELQGPESQSLPEETHVMSIVTTEIFSNDLVPSNIKKRMSAAVQLGRDQGDCSVYKCSDLESLIRKKPE